MPDTRDETVHITGTTPTCDSSATSSAPRPIKVGDTVAWADVPDGAMVERLFDVGWRAGMTVDDAARLLSRAGEDRTEPPSGYEWQGYRRQVVRTDNPAALGITCEEAWQRHDASAAEDRSKPPPGCSEVFNCAGLDANGDIIRGWKYRFGINSDEVLYDTEDLALAAAWAHHDARALTPPRPTPAGTSEEPMRAARGAS